MSQVPPTRRRWFQFGLGTMFLAVTALAAFLAYHVSWIQKRHSVLSRELDIRSAMFRDAKSADVMHFALICDRTTHAPGLLGLFRERGVGALPVFVESSDIFEKLSASDWEYLRNAERLFPEASVIPMFWKPGATLRFVKYQSREDELPEGRRFLEFQAARRDAD